MRLVVLLFACTAVGCGPSPLDPPLQYIADEYESYRVPHEAMFPTVLIGDYFFARRRDVSEAPPSRGDIVIYRLGRANGQKCPVDRCESEPVVEVLFARLVGTPGDVISIQDGQLAVNGESLTASASNRKETTHAGKVVPLHSERIGEHSYEVAIDPERTLGSFGPFSVEAGRYFLLGDYRSNSYDSRFHGTIASGDTIATVASIYWSKVPEGAIRWGRFAHHPE